MSEAAILQRGHPNHQPNPWLTQQLRSPPVLGGLAALRAQWRCCEITVHCARPPELRAGDWMVYALRGAVGDVLFDRDTPGPGRASAWQALYATGHLRRARRQVPSPLLLDVDAGDDAIVVTARLFGFAEAWRDVFLGALISALNNGVSLWENSPRRAPWQVQDFCYVVHQGAHVSVPSGRRMRLLPFGPLCYGAQDHRTDEPERFILSALARVFLIARWQRVLLKFSIPDLATVRNTCTVRKAFQGRMTNLRKHSRWHAQHEMTLSGEATELLLEIEDPEWREALTLASLCAAGGHVAYGFGRFKLESAK